MIFLSWGFIHLFTYLSFGSMEATMARPDGSPVCTVGRAAPSGLHLSNPFTGPISTGQFQVTIDGTVVTDSPDILRIAPETDLPLVVSSTTGTQFRGILVVLNKDGVNLLNRLVTTSTAFKAQNDCLDYERSGITHVDNELKSSATAAIRMPPGLTAFLDVNIVLLNRYPGGSIFYHSRFEITTMVPTAPVSVPMAPIPATLPVAAPATLPLPVAAPLASIPAPLPVTAPATLPLPVAVPMAPIPALLPVTAPATLPLPVAVPVSLPMAPISAPLPVAAPATLPLTIPAPVSVPIAPVLQPLPFSNPVSLPFPITVPVFSPTIPIAISFAPVPLPNAIPVSVPAPMANPLPNPQAPVVMPRPETPVATAPLPTAAPIWRRCGLFRLGLFCRNGCSIFGRLFRFCPYK